MSYSTTSFTLFKSLEIAYIVYWNSPDKPDRKIKRDGLDISDYFFNPGKNRDARPWYYWHLGYLQAVRYGDWKLDLLGQLSNEERQNILKSTYNIVQFSDNLALYNLRIDPGETTNIAE